MSASSPAILDLQDRFRGCLLGLALGDALDGQFEAQTPRDIRGRVPMSAIVEML
jgi:hypothetical protein